MYSEPIRRQAMNDAARSGQPWASGKLELIHQNGTGFLIYMPVFRPTETGRSQLKGFVFSPFRAADFLSAAAELYGARRIQVSIYDGRKTEEDMLVGPALSTSVGRTVDRKLMIAQRPWIVSVSMDQESRLSALSRATLIFGMILALLAAALARVITNRAAEDREVLEWLSRQSAIRTSLTRELNHRVKNTLANVLSIVSLTRRRATSIDDFAESLTGRLKALSATHDLLSQSDWREASIRQLVRAELAPYLDEDGMRISMEGPDISLAPNEALSLGLAIHELATNAAKYGALSAEHGTVRVAWTLVTPEVAEIVWQEAGGPPVSPPTRRGFGLELIERIVAQELKSKVDLEFLPAGIRCRLRVSLRKRGDFALRVGRG
jgi:two-component sensor histidine kinase